MSSPALPSRQRPVPERSAAHAFGVMARGLLENESGSAGGGERLGPARHENALDAFGQRQQLVHVFAPAREIILHALLGHCEFSQR